MPKINIEFIKNNPNRRMDLFKIDPVKVKGLVESINQTGFWDNIMVRPFDNTLADGTAVMNHTEMTAALADGRVNFSAQVFELAYGHHRLEALKEAGIKEIDVPVKYISDEHMMRIMALENKEGWGAVLISNLETVRQAKEFLEKFLKDFRDWADYTSTLEDPERDAIMPKRRFQDAKANGVGYRAVADFLGESWNATDVRIPMAVFKAIDKGYFTQEQIADFPSMGILDAFTALVVALFEGGKVKETEKYTETDDDGNETEKTRAVFPMKTPPAWPLYVKEKIVTDLITQCMPKVFKEKLGDEDDDIVERGKEVKITQSMLTSRKNSMLKDLSIPTKGGTTKYDLRKRLIDDHFRAFVNPPVEQEEREKLHAQLVGKDMENFMEKLGDWPLVDGIAAELKEAFDALLDPVASDEEEKSNLQADLEKEEGKSEDFESRVPEFDIDADTEDGEDAEPVPVGQLCRDFVGINDTLNAIAHPIIARAGEVNIETDELFRNAVDASFGTVMELFFSVYGVSDAMKAMQSLIEERAVELEETEGAEA